MNRNFKKKLNPIWVANTLQCTGPIRIATVNDITRKIQTLVLNTPQNPYINQATPKKCLPKLTFPKQSWNRKFQTQNNPVGFHVSKNCRRILSAPLLMMTGFRKGGFRFFVYGSQQNLDPWRICCLSGQLNPPLGLTKHKISERMTRCKEESRPMLAWNHLLCHCLLKTDYKILIIVYLWKQLRHWENTMCLEQWHMNTLFCYCVVPEIKISIPP